MKKRIYIIDRVFSWGVGGDRALFPDRGQLSVSSRDTGRCHVTKINTNAHTHTCIEDFLRSVTYKNVGLHFFMSVLSFQIKYLREKTQLYISVTSWNHIISVSPSPRRGWGGGGSLSELKSPSNSLAKSHIRGVVGQECESIHKICWNKVTVVYIKFKW